MKILIHYRHFPVAMGRYIHWGLENLGHEVFSVGEYSVGTIPWGENLYYPEYKMPPDLRLPTVPVFPLHQVLAAAKDKGFKPDLVIQAADVSFLYGACPVENVIIGTDPHVVDYNPRLTHANRFFSMQKYYGNNYPGCGWMPYGYSEDIHEKLQGIENKYDVVFCGLQYEHRKEVLEELVNRGLRVFSGLGKIYEDFVRTYNQGTIAFNWSSKQDLPARFWEGLAMGRLVVTNRVPDLKEFPDLVEDRDYVAFETKEEAIEKIQFYLKNPAKAKKISDSGYKQVKPHTYTNRVKKMLKESLSNLEEI